MMTNWYTGRGAAGGAADQPRPPAFSSPMRPEGALAGPIPIKVGVGRERPFAITPRQQPAQVQTRPYVPTPRAEARPLPAFIPGVSPTQGLDSIRQWGGGNPNQPGMMWGDPTWAGGLRGAGLNAPVTRGETSREPRWVDKTTTVKKSAANDVPDTMTTVFKEKIQPASIMNMRIPTSELTGGRDEDRMREMFRVLQGMRARRGY